MTAWIFPIRVAGEKEDYYYNLDGALEEMPSHTIYQSQGRIRSIDVGDMVYFYEGVPVSAIGWKCRVVAVKVPYEAIKEIDDKKFEHGDGGIDDCYIKVTAICRYDGEAREKLSFEKLKENGLNPNLKSIRGSFRPQGELLKYINSIKSSVKYDD